MSLILIDGFDNVSTMPKPGFTPSGDSSSAQDGRDGSTNGSWRTKSLSGQPASSYTFPSSYSPAVVGFGFRSQTITNVQIRISNASGQQLVLMPNTSTGRWELRLSTNSGTLLAQSDASVVYTVNTWVHIQFKVVLNTTTGSFILRINGVEVINYSGQTATANGGLNSLAWFIQAGLGGVDVDDLWLCDTTDALATQGRPFNDFIGDLTVATVVPNGAGDSTGWTPSVGSNYAALDENPPVTTDYVSASAASSGTRDLYTVEDLPSSTKTVLAVQGKVYADKTDAGDAVFKHLVKENGVVSQIGLDGLNLGTDSLETDLVTKRPSDGAVWSVADVNALQVGVEVA